MNSCTFDYLLEKYGLTVRSRDAAAVLGCHPNTVCAMCADGTLPGAIKVGRRWVIPTAKLAAIIEGGGDEA